MQFVIVLFVLYLNFTEMSLFWKAQLITTNTYPKLTIYNIQTTKLKRFRTQRNKAQL